MIVSCPECRTLFRNRAGARRSARCGACHAEIRLPSARTYRIRAVGEATLRPITPVPILATAGAGPSPATGATSWTRRDPPVRRAVVGAPWSEPDAGSSDRRRDDEPTRSASVDRRLDEIARTAEEANAIEGSTARNVLFGVGIGAVAGVAFAPGLFDASWVSWAVGGAMGGVAAALWSRAWGLRRV